jgi:hypothetical protein
MFPDAPGRFSTTTLCPSRAPSFSEITRALESATPPGENGTMMRSGLEGKGCAAAAKEKTLATSRRRGRIGGLISR